MKKIETPKSPKAVGPYSQAILCDGWLFVSGQLPINPRTGEIETLDIKGQTQQVLENIFHILEAASCSFQQVVRVEIFLKDLQHFEIVNAIYASIFTNSLQPARQTIQVARLPRDSLIEISCIAKCI